MISSPNGKRKCCKCVFAAALDHFRHLLTFWHDSVFLGRPSEMPRLDWTPFVRVVYVGYGPNTVSESMVSNTKLSDFFCAHRAPGRELSEFLSACFLCA